MIFERALRRELLNAASAVFTTLFTITITFMLIRILGDAAGGKIASSDVLILIGFNAFGYFPILLILTGFISVLLVVTRAYQDSEMVVWFASGLSLTRWVKPVLSFAVPFTLLIATLSLFVSPWAYEQQLEVRNRYEKREDISKVAPGKFQESRKSGRVTFVEEVSGDLTRVQNIFISSEENDRTSVIVAKEGKIDIDQRGDRFLVMSQGRRYDGLPTEGDFQMMQFEKYSVLIPTQSMLDANNKLAKALPLQTLLEDPTPAHDAELLWRVSLPMIGLLLTLLAIPLGYVNPRVGRSANLIAALFFVSINITMLNMLQLAVVGGRMSFWKASWPMHAIVASFVFLFFVWRLKINSRLHPTVIWMKLKLLFRPNTGKPLPELDQVAGKS